MKDRRGQLLIIGSVVVVITLGSMYAMLLSLKRPCVKTFSELRATEELVSRHLASYLAKVTSIYHLNTTYADACIIDDQALKSSLYSIQLSVYRTDISFLSSMATTDWRTGDHSTSTAMVNFVLSSESLRKEVTSSASLSVHKANENTTLLPSESIPRYVNYEIDLNVKWDDEPIIGADISAYASLDGENWFETDVFAERRLDGTYHVELTLVYGEEYGKLVVSWKGIRCEMPINWTV